MAAILSSLLPNAKQTFYDSNGVPLVGGTVTFYIPNTSTPKNTWQDPSELVLNTNPVVLDSLGSAIIYGSGQYRQVLKDVNGNIIWDDLTASTNAGSTYLNVVTQFGAVGNGVADDTAALQSGLTYIKNNGGCLYFPTGLYRITSALSVTFTNTSNNNLGRPSLRGDGPGQSRILWDGANTPSVYALSLQRTDASDNFGLHALSVIDGIGISPITSGKNGYCSGLYLSKWAFLNVSNIYCNNLSVGSYFDQIISTQFNKLVMANNTYGAYSVGQPTSLNNGVYANNALQFNDCTFGGNSIGGFTSLDSSFVMISGSIENNGLGGTGGTGYGAYINNTAGASPQAASFINVFLEQNGTTGNLGANTASADIWISHTDTLDNLTYNVQNCTFIRSGTNYAPFGIYVNRTATTSCTLSEINNVFTDYNGYSASSSRPYVKITDSSGSSSSVVINTAGSYYNQSTEEPSYITGTTYFTGRGYQPGAVVYPSMQQSIPNNTTTAITFSTALYNNFGIFNVSNPTQLVVPQNVFHVRIGGNIRFANSNVDGSNFILLLHKNGSAAFNGNPRVSLETGPNTLPYEMNCTSPILPVAAGDIFELCVLQATGGALNTDSVFTSQWFSMELID